VERGTGEEQVNIYAATKKVIEKKVGGRKPKRKKTVNERPARQGVQMEKTEPVTRKNGTTFQDERKEKNQSASKGNPERGSKKTRKSAQGGALLKKRGAGKGESGAAGKAQKS